MLGQSALSINADLSVGIDLTGVPRLAENLGIAFMGDSKGGPFNILPDLAQKMLPQSNPHGRPNRDVVVPWINGLSVTRQPRDLWIIDFGTKMSKAEAALYEAPFEYVRKHVLPKREVNRREAYAEKWWMHVEPRSGMRKALAGLARFIGTVRHAKHRIFFWIPAGTLPDSALIVFARDDDYSFGVLQSRAHTVWSLAKGTQVREKETGFRYTPTTTFETFSFPRPTEAQRDAIATAAHILDSLRQGWLRPEGAESSKLATRTLTNLHTQKPTWLLEAHERLDRAVFAAYGWKDDLDDQELLGRLLATNAERTPAE